MGVAEILSDVVQLVPLALKLVERLHAIKTQTEADHPEVWAAIRDDWNATVAKRNALLGD